MNTKRSSEISEKQKDKKIKRDDLIKESVKSKF